VKKIIMFTLICVMAFAGCNKTINQVIESFRGGQEGNSWNAVKLDKETAYYNDYLGISYTIPRGWWFYDVSDDNFSEIRGDITDVISMDVAYGDYENYTYSSLRLIRFGNLEKSTHDNHLGFSLDAWSIEEENDMAGFMKYFETYMLEPTEDADYSLLESQQITIKGKPFELRDYLVSRAADDFCVITLTCEVKNGFFLNITVDYWPYNTKAKQAIIDSVTRAVGFY